MEYSIIHFIYVKIVVILSPRRFLWPVVGYLAKDQRARKRVLTYT